MFHECIYLGGFHLAGVNYYSNPLIRQEDTDTEKMIDYTWNRYMAHLDKEPIRPYSVDEEVVYEVHIYNEEGSKEVPVELFIGEVANSDRLPLHLVAKYLPGSEYILMTLKGDEINSDYRSMAISLVEKYGRKTDERFLILRYDERYKGLEITDESEMDVLIPVYV